MRRGGRAQTVEASCTRAPVWACVHVFRLQTNIRLATSSASESEKFRTHCIARFWGNVGDGKAPNVVGDGTYTDQIEIPSELCRSGATANDLLRDAAPDLRDHVGGAAYFTKRVVLTRLNATARALNAATLEAFSAPSIMSSSIDAAGHDEGPAEWPMASLHFLDTAGVPPRELPLKNGAPYFFSALLRNRESGSKGGPGF